MRHFLFLLLIVTVHIAQAQPTLRVGANTRLLGSGAVRLVYSGGTLTNNGSLSLATGQLIATGPSTYDGTGSAFVNTAVFNHTTGGSTLNRQLSVTGQATLATSTSLNANGQLYLRTDLFPAVNLVNNGLLTGTVLGLVTKASQTSATAPFSSTLSTNVSGSSMQYQWQSSPDNSQWTNVPAATSPSYTAAVSGKVYYRCQLTTTNSTYSQTTPAVLLIVPSLTLITSASPNPVCAGSTVALSVSATDGTGPYSYTWAAPAGISLSGTSTSAVSATVGTGLSGVQTLTVTVADGSLPPSINTSLISLTVNALPTAQILSPASSTLSCSTPSLSLTASGGTSYRWDNSTTSAVRSVSASGTYSVTVADGASCSAIATQSIGSNLTLSLEVGSSLPQANVGVVVSLTASGATTYQWSVPATTLLTTPATGSAVSVSLTTAGVQTFTVVGTTGACSQSALVSVTALAGPDLSATLNLPDANFPAGSSKGLLMQLQEVNGSPASGAIVITITVPAGYSLSFDNTLTSINVSGGSNSVAVQNSRWQISSSVGSQQLSLRLNGGESVGAGSTMNLGIMISRTSANSGSVSNITVNVADDSSGSYDVNRLNNVYARIISGL